MKKRTKASLCLLLAVCMAALFLPGSVTAQQQPGTPTDLPEAVASPLRNDQPKTPAYDKTEYSENDVNVINAIIDGNGLQASKDDPENWGFITWSQQPPKRVTELYLYDEKLIGALDVSGLAALEFLDCSGNQLTTVNVTGLSALDYLSCSDNQLKTLNVTGLPVLYYLNCSGNQLKTLNVTGLPALNNLNCSGNQLTTLNVTGLSALQSLDCSGNQLKTLNVTGLSALQSLDCSGNQLTALNVSGLTALTLLICEDNPFTSLDLTGLPQEIAVYCGLTRLTDPSGAVLTFEAVQNGFVRISSYNGTQKEVNIEAYAKLGYTFTGWGDGDTSSWRNLAFAQAAALTPNFVQETAARYHKEDMAALEKLITDLRLEGKNGIRIGYPDTYGFIADWQHDGDALTDKRLIELNLSDLGLTGTLDVSVFTALNTLWCYDNQLTGLKCSGLANLQRLHCDHNQLTALDVSGLSALDYLDCKDNQLTALDVSGLTALRNLSCLDNPLTSLKLLNNRSIEIVVTGSGQPWLADFTYQAGQPTGYYTAKPAPGYGGTWENLVGFIKNGDEMQFNLKDTGEDATSASLIFARNAALTADPTKVEITADGVQPGGQVEKGNQFTFTAPTIGTGAADAYNGDIQYVPERWSVNPSGDFSTGPTQSFSTADMDLGNHTLSVTYRKQKHNGTAWQPLDETVEKTLSFTLTGQNTPGGNPPGGNTPGGNTPGGNTPGGNTPGGNTPGGNTPGGNTPGGNTPGGNTPAGQPEAGTGTSSANPGTGDSGYAWYLIGIALAGGAFLLLLRNKKTV